MRYAQYLEQGRIRVGVIEGESLRPLDFDGDLIDLISAGKARRAGLREPRALAETKLTAPVLRPSKVIAIGLNYRDHAEESKGQIPAVPLVFAKFPSSIIGPRDPIRWDSAVTAKVDYEAELAVIIGRRVSHCPEREAMAAVWGYCCANDVSARDLQFGDKQWVRGKSLDTFCPLGPWVVTREELPEPNALYIRCWLNGRIMQDSHTSRMIFGVPYLVSFLSRHFTLQPGDVILTGTPAGVGAFREPSVYMGDGDEVAVEIEGLGRLINPCQVKKAENPNIEIRNKSEA